MGNRELTYKNIVEFLREMRKNCPAALPPDYQDAIDRFVQDPK